MNENLQRQQKGNAYKRPYYYDHLASNVLLASAVRTYLAPPLTINYRSCAKYLLQKNTAGEVCLKSLSSFIFS